MQKLVRKIMSTKHEDTSIKRVFEELTERGSAYYIVEKPFRTFNKVFRQKWDYLHLESFSDYEEVWVREQVVDRSWKVCDHCGQKIRAGEQFSKKCWKCKKGWFHFSNETIVNWHLLERGFRERVIETLLEKDYIKIAPLKKRLDFFRYRDGIFEIYETKNKEKTGLSSQDLRKTLVYPFIVHNSGFTVKKFVMIYNGFLTDELRREIRKGYGRNFPFRIELCPIGDYLELNNVHIKAIKVSKKKNRYTYQLIRGSDDKIIIDLTET